MNLFEIFNVEPLPEIVVEYPVGSGIFHIPIEEVKKMLWGDFVSWGTKKFKFNIHLIGHSVFVSGKCELVLVHKEFGKFKFLGAYTYDHSKDTPEPELKNDNLEATVLAECIKNASKNLGRKYGMFLNTKRIANRIPPPTPKKLNMKDSVKSILKDT